MVFEFEDKKIDYIIEGEGKTVLLLHGFMANKEAFTLVTNSLKKNYKVVALDLLGFGKSDSADGYSVLDYAKSLKAFIEGLNLDVYACIAHSFGGRVIIKYLGENMGKIEKLILVDSAGIKPRRSLKYYFKVYTYKTLKKLGVKKLDKFGSNDYKSLSDGMKHTFIKVVNEDLKKYLKNIESETLIIFGEKDKDTPLYMARKLKKGIRKSALLILKNAGHFSYIDKFFEFDLIVKSFLKT